PAEFRFRLFTFDRKLGLDPDRRSVDMDLLVDSQRAARGKRNALRADNFIVWGQWRFLKENERAVLAAQLLSLFGIGFHEFANLVHGHLFPGDDSAVDQKLADRGIGHAVAG